MRQRLSDVATRTLLGLFVGALAGGVALAIGGLWPAVAIGPLCAAAAVVLTLSRRPWRLELRPGAYRLRPPLGGRWRPCEGVTMVRLCRGKGLLEQRDDWLVVTESGRNSAPLFLDRPTAAAACDALRRACPNAATVRHDGAIDMPRNPARNAEAVEELVQAAHRRSVLAIVGGGALLLICVAALAGLLIHVVMEHDWSDADMVPDLVKIGLLGGGAVASAATVLRGLRAARREASSG